MSLIRPFFKKEKNRSARIHMEDPESANKIGSFLNLLFGKDPSIKKKTKVLICIGSDRSTGDCLGPLVGSKLLKNKEHDFRIMGTLESPVHATNLKEYLDILESVDDPFVIAIDACLGSMDSVGYINVAQGPLKPGAGVNKCLPPVGDLHITGIVNVGGFMEYFVLQNTRLSTVMKMADIISVGLVKSCKSP